MHSCSGETTEELKEKIKSAVQKTVKSREIPERVGRDFKKILEPDQLLTFILGAGPCEQHKENSYCYSCPDREACGYFSRRLVTRDAIIRLGHVALLPESVVSPRFASPEQFRLFSSETTDLIIIFAEDRGAIGEYNQYFRDPLIGLKVRLFVNRIYHPIYGDTESFNVTAYREFLSVRGHVYVFELEDGKVVSNRFPPFLEVVETLVDTYSRCGRLYDR